MSEFESLDSSTYSSVAPEGLSGMKDFQNRIDQLEKENYNLKLKIYFMVSFSPIS